MISNMAGMEWVKVHFQTPHCPITTSTGAIGNHSNILHPRTRLAITELAFHDHSITLLVFQDNIGRLRAGTLGKIDVLADTPIIVDQIAPGSPLAICESCWSEGSAKVKYSKLCIYHLLMLEVD
jgi:hypothetical protein